jgi:DNA-binding transcriptional LysR family regulator
MFSIKAVHVVVNLRNFDLNLLAVFEAIYELGSVSNAARHLGLSQPATSHSLSRLRDLCKDELFVRNRGALSPTPVAQAIHPVVSHALTTLRAGLSQSIGFDPATSERRFNVAIPHPFGPLYALHLRHAAATRAPRISIKFDTVTRPLDLDPRLREGEVDLVVDWLPIEADPFVNRPVFEDRIVLLAREGHPIARPGMTYEDMRQCEFVSIHHRRERQNMPPVLRTLVPHLHETLLISELLEIPTVVACTDLVGIFPSSMVLQLGALLHLQALELPMELPNDRLLTIYLVWHEARRNDAAHRWLRALIEEELPRFTDQAGIIASIAPGRAIHDPPPTTQIPEA